MTRRPAPGGTSAGLSEAGFQRMVLALASACGWLAYHTYDSRRSVPGFPDLCMVRGGRLIFAELKSETGRVRPDQQIWMDRLADVDGVDVFLWRPSDLDAIEDVLMSGLGTSTNPTG